MKILALEPYYGGSHKAFLDGLVGHSSHDIRTITMKDRFWKWRMHGASVTLARKAKEMLEEEEFLPELILATDMVNVPTFLALTRDCFHDIPVILYFHENQLTYPLRGEEKRDYTYAYINYLSCLAADCVVFNSSFHHDQFLSALPGMLKAFPDYTHFQTSQEIRRKSRVLHLGMRLKEHDNHELDGKNTSWRGPNGLPTILWNQRWEYDKRPEDFFRMMNRVDDAGHKFQLILAGEHFEEQPPEFERAFTRYAERILHYGYVEDFQQYTKLLHQSDIVISTSIHEFFGLAIMEATYCGCHPLLPRRLSYPELIPDNLQDPLLHSPIFYSDEDELFLMLSNLITGKQKPLPVQSLKKVVSHLNWDKHVEKYDELFSEVIQTKSSS